MSREVRLEDHVYERIEANKRDGESFSEAVERLIGGPSIRDLQTVFDAEQVDEMREAVETADSEDVAETDEIGERFG